MKLNVSKNANINYLAKIVEIKDFTAHINPEVTRLKVAHVDGYNILVGIDEQPGKFVYFPTSSCLNPQFLAFANLYRHAEKNNDNEKTGLFEDNGRVKAVKLKGQVSEGFLLPLTTLVNFIVDSTNVSFTEDDCPVGTEFDEVEHNGKSFWINKKYVVERQGYNYQKRYNKSQKKLSRLHLIRDDQFRYHYETVLIRKEPTFISPDDTISITSKWDGTSHISAYVLCHKQLNFFEKIQEKLFKRNFDFYDHILSSRRVIKNLYYNPEQGASFYNDEFRYKVDEYLQPYMCKGMTIYAEIVGFDTTGGYIQKNYDYGCVQPEKGEEYTIGKHCKVMIYRITLTNVDGVVHEFSAKEVQVWCKERGLNPVIEYYYGLAKDLYPELDTATHWNQNFIECLANDKRFYMEMDSPDCNNKVPHEGIVIKKESMRSEAVKLKCFNYLNKEQSQLDKGEVNIEDIA
mgnify:CR=1 FL=1